jgi:hypothetical protein
MSAKTVDRPVSTAESDSLKQCNAGSDKDDAGQPTGQNAEKNIAARRDANKILEGLPGE